MHPDVYLELFEDEMGLDTMGLSWMYPQLIETIQRRTFPVFSELFPCIYPYVLDPKDTTNRIPDKFSGNSAEFRIEDPVLDDFGLKVLSFRQLYPVYEKSEYEHGYNNAYLAGVGAYNGSFDDMLIGNIAAETNSMFRGTLGLNPICKLKGPRLLSIKHFTDYAPYLVELIITYPNVSSMQETFKRYFLNLAKFDVGIYLYAKLKYMQDVVTPAGNVDLKISEWESYPRDKEDYIRELRTLSFPDRVESIYFLAV